MFYGWKIVLVTFLTLFVSVGFSFYSYGAFFKAIAADLGGSRLGIGIGLAIMNCATGLFAPFLGRALDRGSIRNLMAMGTVLMATGFFALSRIEVLWQFYLGLGTFLAVGAALQGGVAGSTLVSNWFVRRRGIALGVATMGVSLSGVVMAPVTTALIQGMGWRHCFVLFGALTLALVLPAVWWLVVSRPEEMGLRPDGDTEAHAPLADVVEPVIPLAPGDQVIDHAPGFAWSARAVLRERNFWVIAMTIALNFSANGALLTHIIPHATDLGVDAPRAAMVLSCIAGVGVVGKVAFGWVTDHLDKRFAVWICSGLQATAVVVLLHVDAYPELLATGALFGLGMGGLLPLWGAMVGSAFGRHAFGRVMGLMSPMMLPIQILGVPFAGYVFDRSGSYDLAFEFFAGAYLASMVTIALLRLPRVEPGWPRGTRSMDAPSS